MFGGRATTSTLVKRGAKAEPTEDHPSKRVKVEGDTSGVEDEVKKCYEKGTVSKVSIRNVFGGKEPD
jgi:ATP-dependent DNA helicase 2 subunit 1